MSETMGSMSQLDERSWEFTASQTSSFEEKKALYYRQGEATRHANLITLSFGNASRSEVRRRRSFAVSNGFFSSLIARPLGDSSYFPLLSSTETLASEERL